MSFWKLVAAIVIGNLLTGVVATILWLMFMASLLGAASGLNGFEVNSARAIDGQDYEVLVNGDGALAHRGLSNPDQNGCIKELAEQSGGHC